MSPDDAAACERARAPDDRDLVIVELADSEAALRARIVHLEAELAAERELRRQLLEQLHTWARDAAMQQRRYRQIQREMCGLIATALAADAGRSEAA